MPKKKTPKRGPTKKKKVQISPAQQQRSSVSGSSSSSTSSSTSSSSAHATSSPSQTMANANASTSSPDPNASAASQDPVNVFAVAPKLPKFAPDDVGTWFLQAEAEFRTKGIKCQTTKFSHIITILKPEHMRKVRRVSLTLEKDPECYTKLKAAMFKAFQLTPAQKVAKIAGLTLGDSTALDLMQIMLQIMDRDPDPLDAFFRTAFINKMPMLIRSGLWETDYALDWEDLAIKADRLLSGIPDQERLNVLAATPAPAAGEVDINVGSSRGAARGGGRNRGRRGARGGRGGASGSTGQPLCWYHWRFGAEARQCPGAPDCSYRASGNATPGS